MPTTPTKRKPDPALLPRTETQPAPAPVKNRRRVGYLAGAAALLLVCGLLAVFIVNTVQTRYRVLQLRADLRRGQIVQITDLAAVSVGDLTGISTVPAEQIEQIAGKVALVDLVKGSLLPAGAVGERAVPAPNNSLVGLTLTPNKVPDGVQPGTKVHVVILPAADQNSDPDKNVGTSFAATIRSISTSADGATVQIAIEVSGRVASRAALYSAANRLACFKDPD